MKTFKNLINYEFYKSDLTLLNAFSLFTEDVKSEIMSMSQKKIELKSFQIPVLKICIYILIRHLPVIINKLFISGRFPFIWKKTIITPLLKIYNKQFFIAADNKLF